jgi:VWFA-related protein
MQRGCLLCLAAVWNVWPEAAVAQTAPAGASAHPGHLIAFDAIVNDADGKPTVGLTPQDFTVLDDGKPVKLASFHAVNESPSAPNVKPDTPMEVTILFDTVNASVADVSYERQQITDFLRANGGQLTQPVSLSFFTAHGVEKVGTASRDGNALAAALDKAADNQLTFWSSSGYFGALERYQVSIATLGSLITENAKKAGRKMLLWISPGWPLLMGTDARTGKKETEGLFQNIVAMSNGLRQARLILYSVYPVHDSGLNLSHWFYYKDYLQGVTKPSKAFVGNLALEVLAEQSGGQALNFSSEYLSGEIAKCIAAASADYFLAFATPAAADKDEYHSLKITVDRPGAVVHTRAGYYNQP